SADTYRFYNRARAVKRFIPASTFKIANSLIGLNTGAVKSVDEVLPYGGEPQPFKDWEHDMPLREAIKLSAVPIYQELARRIGLQKMTEGVKALGYGNQIVGDRVDRFWLDGPLEISALEQVQFLARLINGTLPVNAEALKAVREITLREHEERFDFHYKTGWGTSTKPHVGWIVGWVEAKEGSYPFALNIDMAEEKDAPKRLRIARGCLQALGKLP
ncbi:MAG: class beta-lactamase, partial [Chthoniobacteraceae bacterium]|nr:class beta-lactamase [Chthoniobacteraceae bacterium]